MNDAAHLTRILQQLFKAFPDSGTTDQNKLERLRLYVNELVDLDPQAVALAVKRIIDTNVFFPRIAEIRAAVLDLSQPVPDSALDAWNHWERGRGNELAKDLMRKIGIDHFSLRLMTMYERGRVQSEFTREYNRRTEAARQRALLPPIVKEHIERIEAETSQRVLESQEQQRGHLRLVHNRQEPAESSVDRSTAAQCMREILQSLTAKQQARERQEAEAAQRQAAGKRELLRQQAMQLLNREGAN